MILKIMFLCVETQINASAAFDNSSILIPTGTIN